MRGPDGPAECDPGTDGGGGPSICSGVNCANAELLSARPSFARDVRSLSLTVLVENDGACSQRFTASQTRSTMASR